MYTSETDLTPAITAAARAAHARGNEELRATLPPSAAARLSEWEDIGPLPQNQWREFVLPLVAAAVDALPDPRYATWEAGYQAGKRGDSHDNPFPLEF